MSTKTCTRCREIKPLTAFGADLTHADKKQSHCKACKAEAMQLTRAQQTPEERNAQQAAFRAGMRKDKCAVCGSAIEGHGICSRCAGAIAVLGGSEADLKRAAKAIKYLQGL